MRDTRYAKEIASVAIDDTRVERLFGKSENQEEIRLSWWPGGNLANRPVAVAEALLIELPAKGIQEGVLSSTFLPRLITATAAE
jgi:hypothetical protein